MRGILFGIKLVYLRFINSLTFLSFRVTARRLRGNNLFYILVNKILVELVGFISRARRKSAGADSSISFYSPPSAVVECNKPFYEIVVNCDGRAYCGTSESRSIGDLNTQNFMDVWNGARMQDIRRCMLGNSPRECGDCSLYSWRYHDGKKYKKGILLDGGPQVLLIEPTVMCNLDCPLQCGRNFPEDRSKRADRKTKYMSMDLFRKIIDGTGGKAGSIGFFNFGEPFLHREIISMIRYAREKCPGAYLFTSTNGMPLHREKLLDEAIDSGIDELLFSVDGARQKSYEKYRKGGSLKIALDVMEKIVKKRKSSRPKVIWRYLLFYWNDSDRELREAEKIALDLGVDAFSYHLSDVLWYGSQKYIYGKKKFDYIAPFLHETNRFNFDYEAEFIENNVTGIKLRVKNTGNIRWNSIERPWEKYVYFELFGRTGSDGSREVLDAKKMGRDVAPGEEIIVQFESGQKNKITKINSKIYFDCILNNNFRFEERKGSAYEVPVHAGTSP